MQGPPAPNSSYISYNLTNVLNEFLPYTHAGPCPLKFLLHLLQSYWAYIQSSTTHKHAEPCPPSNFSYMSYSLTDFIYEALPHTQMQSPALPPLKFLLHLLQSYLPSIRSFTTHTHICRVRPHQISLTSLTILLTLLQSYRPYITKLYHTHIHTCRALFYAGIYIPIWLKK